MSIFVRLQAVFSGGSADALTEMLRASAGPLLMTSKFQTIPFAASAVRGAWMVTVSSAGWAKAVTVIRETMRERKTRRRSGRVIAGLIRRRSKQRPHIIRRALTEG